MADSNEMSELDLLKMAAALDAGLDKVPDDVESAPKIEESETPQAENTEEQPATPEAAETKQDASSDAPATKDKTEEAKSSLTTQSDESKSGSEPEKKLSKYERAKERAKKEWDDIQAEKARIKAEREALEAAKAEREADKSRSEEATKGNRRFSSDDYRDAAKSYREEGRDDLAKLAEQKATEIEAEDQKSRQEKIQADLKKAWDENLYKEVEANPELKDSNTNLYKAVSQMLQAHAILRNYPSGINDAVAIAKWKLGADSASDLSKKVAEYERELAQLRKATTPASGQPSAPAKKKEFHQLSLADQEKELLRMAAEADRG
jgi:hypothetical protein